MNYREYKEGDTVRITGCQGRLFRHFGDIRLNDGVSLGVECVLVGGEDYQHDVQLPRGILAEDQTYISISCIELVHAIEAKTPTVKYMYEGPDDHLCAIDDSESKFAIARIWYDPRKVPMGVVKSFVENIKDIVTKRKTKNSKSIMEIKTINDEFESKFGDFERQLAEMPDEPHPNEIREFIATVILASAHDNSLVDAAFKWVENKNNTPNKEVEDHIKLLVKILLEDVKEGKLLVEKQESDPGKDVVVDFLFTPNSCTKKIKVTFDYNELTKKINCSKTVLDDNE